MNKKLICLLMFVFSLSLAFTACSDDDDDKKVDYARDIAATYAGTLSIPGLSVDPITLDKDITLSRSAENKVKVELKDLTLQVNEGSTMNVGTISVDNIEISKSSGTYTLKETTASITIDLVPTPVDVAVSGTVKDNKLTLKIVVTKIPVFETLNISFVGDKKNK